MPVTSRVPAASAVDAHLLVDGRPQVVYKQLGAVRHAAANHIQSGFHHLLVDRTDYQCGHQQVHMAQGEQRWP